MQESGSSPVTMHLLNHVRLSIRSLLAGSCAAAIAVVSGTAHAQTVQPDATAASDSRKDGSGGIDEILVTAQKREERLQDVPIAITALTGDDLANKQILRLEDIGNIVPNLYLEQGLGSPTQTKIFLRGGGSVNPVFSFDSPIGFYFDDVYIARSIGALRSKL